MTERHDLCFYYLASNTTQTPDMTFVKLRTPQKSNELLTKKEVFCYNDFKNIRKSSKAKQEKIYLKKIGCVK